MPAPAVFCSVVQEGIVVVIVLEIASHSTEYVVVQRKLEYIKVFCISVKKVHFCHPESKSNSRAGFKICIVGKVVFLVEAFDIMSCTYAAADVHFLFPLTQESINMDTTDIEKMKALGHVIRHLAYMEGVMETKSNNARNYEMRSFYSELKDMCEDVVLRLQSRIESIGNEPDREELFPNG